MTEEIDNDDDELVRKAKLLAEATGRSFEDVLEDLLDDGELNNSNSAKADLVTQLKEAAELITTVQSINQQVTENTVLNGGDNKTEVKVETTLEGDIIDRAIESAQRKADNFKKLILTLAPIFLLLTGGAGLEVLGVTDMVGSEDNNYNPDSGCVSFWMYDDNSYVLGNTIYVETTFYDDNYCDIELEGHFIVSLFVDGAFSNQKTINTEYFRDYYDLSVQWSDLASGNYQISVEFHTIECEDGTCEHGPEWESPHRPSFSIDTGTSDCEPDWWWQNEAIFDHDHDGQGFNNDLRVQVDFRDLNSCNEHMNNGYFEIMVGDEDQILEYNFHDEFTINEHYLNLPAGDYYVTIDYYTYDGSHWGGPEAWVTMESEPEPVRGCTDSSATNYDDKATEDDGSCEYPSSESCDAFIDNLDTTVTDYGIDVTFFIGQTQDSECENFEIEVILLPANANPEQEISYETGLAGTSNYFSYSFGFVPEGDWQVEAVVRDGNGDLDVQYSEWLTVEYPEPVCDYISIYSIYLENFTDSVRVTYDLDCPTDTQNEAVIVLSVRATGTSDILNMEFSNHTVVGANYDNWRIELWDFIDQNYTHYDFTWMMTYQDSNGQYWSQFQNWTNIEFEVSEPEPEPCDNLSLVSDGITLGKDATDNLTMDWKLNHDGPADSSCFVELEVSITLYQNGTYYDVSDFHKNGVHKIYVNGTLFLDASDVDVFADLPEGTYEILVKYRIVGETSSSQDYFANSVTIGSPS